MTPEEYRQGRRRLRDLLPAAKAAVANDEGEVRATSAIATAMRGNVTEANFDAVVVVPAPLGGWHCDLMFKDVPPGVPNAIGSPVETPFRTRAEAEAHAKILLVTMLKLLQLPKGDPTPVFQLYGCAFKMLPEAVESVRRVLGDDELAYGSREVAIERIRDILTELCPTGFNVDDFNKRWPPIARAKLLTVLHMSVLSGVFRYPPRMDKPPAAEASETRH